MENLGRDAGNQGLGLPCKPASPLETPPATPPFIVLSGGDKPRSHGQLKTHSRINRRESPIIRFHQFIGAHAENFSLDRDQGFPFSSVLFCIVRENWRRYRRESPIIRFHQFIGACGKFFSRSRPRFSIFFCFVLFCSVLAERRGRRGTIGSLLKLKRISRIFEKALT